EHAAEHFAANIGSARFTVGHDPTRGRKDRDAQAVIDLRQIGDLRIDPPAGLRDPADLLDHRLAIRIFQLDVELGHAGPHIDLAEATDVAFATQYFQHVRPDLGGRRNDA